MTGKERVVLPIKTFFGSISKILIFLALSNLTIVDKSSGKEKEESILV